MTIPARIDLANAGEAVTMLEGLVRLNQQQLRSKPLPPLYGSGIRYKREAGTGERWQTIRQLYASRRGDCEDLAAALCAQKREAGQACRVDLVRTGPRLLHAIVRFPDGTIEDPSKALGM